MDSMEIAAARLSCPYEGKGCEDGQGRPLHAFGGRVNNRVVSARSVKTPKGRNLPKVIFVSFLELPPQGRRGNL